MRRFLISFCPSDSLVGSKHREAGGQEPRRPQQVDHRAELGAPSHVSASCSQFGGVGGEGCGELYLRGLSQQSEGLDFGTSATTQEEPPSSSTAPGVQRLSGLVCEWRGEVPEAIPRVAPGESKAFSAGRMT